MRRKSTGPLDASSFNVMHAVDPTKLQTFAAIVIVWNYIENYLDAVLGDATKVATDLFPRISSRSIDGIDGKIAAIKEAFIVEKVDEGIRTAVSETLNTIEAYKKYRDGLVHVKLPGPATEIAETIQRRGVRDEVLISQDALTALYYRLLVVLQELHWVFWYMHSNGLAGHLASGSEKERYELLAGESLAQLQMAQRRREVLPPLPKFPDELQAPRDSEAYQGPPG